MRLITVALTLLVIRLAILLASRHPIHREIAEGHTCVHFLDETGQRQNPAIPSGRAPHGHDGYAKSMYTLAILTIVKGKLHVTDLATNTTIDPVNSNTIRMTSPVYRGRSLNEVLQGQPLFDWRNPTVRRIFEQRAKNGWTQARERCQRHWTELTGSWQAT